MVVESASNPILLTRKIIPEKINTTKIDREFNATELFDFFRVTLDCQRYALKISESLSMEKLKLIVKYGLNGLNKSDYSCLDLTNIENLANKLLDANYRYVCSALFNYLCKLSIY